MSLCQNRLLEERYVPARAPALSTRLDFRMPDANVKVNLGSNGVVTTRLDSTRDRSEMRRAFPI